MELAQERWSSFRDAGAHSEVLELVQGRWSSLRDDGARSEAMELAQGRWNLLRDAGGRSGDKAHSRPQRGLVQPPVLGEVSSAAAPACQVLPPKLGQGRDTHSSG